MLYLDSYMHGEFELTVMLTCLITVNVKYYD